MSIQFPLHVLSQLASAVTQAPQPALADATHVEKFRESLATATSAPGSAQPDVRAVDAAVPAVDGAAAASPGEAILRGLGHLRQRMNGGWADAVGHIDSQNGPMTTTQLLQFQSGVLQMGFEYQMVGSIAGKATQGIDQLVKMQ